VIRSRSPAVRTLPSSTVATPSRDPTASRPDVAFRNWNDALRAATRRPATCVSAVMSSSAMPSQSQPWSPAWLEPGDAVRRGRRADDLDRHGPVQPRIPRAVDLAHSAFAQLFLDPIWTKRFADHDGVVPCLRLLS
jgi:hypothetical protein